MVGGSTRTPFTRHGRAGKNSAPHTLVDDTDQRHGRDHAPSQTARAQSRAKGVLDDDIGAFEVLADKTLKIRRRPHAARFGAFRLSSSNHSRAPRVPRHAKPR